MAKRHPSLVLLSHDHHHGLALALRLRQGDTALLTDGWTHDRNEQARHVLRFYEAELSVHFRLEEAVLFPAMIKHVPDSSSLVENLVAQHRQMEKLVERLQTTQSADLEQTLVDLGTVLESHIRSEERDLFPRFERTITEHFAREIGSTLQSMRHSITQSRQGRKM